MELVIKRDGTKVEFDKEKIYNAIDKANQDVAAQDKNCMTELAVWDAVADVIVRCEETNDNIEVETIQDIVEEVLMSYCPSVARAYMRYRYKKEVGRNLSTDFIDTIGKKLKATDVQNQNANVDEFSFGGRIGEASNELMKKYALDFCMSDMAKRNHLNNEIYTHDLNAYAVGEHNCMSIPFDDLLAKGFNTRQTDVRPANSINTAFQLLAIIFQLQSLQQFGGCSSTHLDWTMVPYVRKSFYKHFRDGVTYLLGIDFGKYEECIDINKTSIDDDFYHSFGDKVHRYALEMSERELNQAVEGMYHNLK